jgi:hypothetical protein
MFYDLKRKPDFLAFTKIFAKIVIVFSAVRRSVSTETEICEEIWKVRVEIDLKFRGNYEYHWAAFHKIRACSKFLRDCCTEFYANPFSNHGGTVLGDP